MYNILSKEWMDSFKDLKCPPVEFVHGMNHPTMSVSNLKNIKESIFILDDVAHEDKDSKIRNFHTVMNHHNSNLSFLLLHTLYSREIKCSREVGEER